MLFSFWAILAAPCAAGELAGGGSHAPAAAARLVEAEQTLLELINDYRSERGLSRLTWNDRLAAVAEAHNDDMVRHDYFAHCNAAGDCLSDRLRAAGYGFRSAAENLAAGQRRALSVLRSWQGSPGHNSNLLAESMTEAGIDVDPRSVKGTARLWTLVLGQPVR